MRERKSHAHYAALPYRVDLYRDPEDGVWIARCPELPGVKADGATQEKALAAVHEMKALWIQTAAEKGRRIPEPEPEPPYSGKLNLRLSRSLHERAALAARAEGVSLNTFLTQAVSERLEHHGYQQVMRNVMAGVTKVLQKLPDAGAVTSCHCGKRADRKGARRR